MPHTPGPWRFAQDGDEPYWNVDMPMQDGSSGYGFANAMVYTTEEDARLIAAAPDLLAALKGILEDGQYDNEGDFVIRCTRVEAEGDYPDYIEAPCLRAASLAIRKAEGRG